GRASRDSSNQPGGRNGRNTRSRRLIRGVRSHILRIATSEIRGHSELLSRSHYDSLSFFVVDFRRRLVGFAGAERVTAPASSNWLVEGVTVRKKGLPPPSRSPRPRGAWSESPRRS